MKKIFLTACAACSICFATAQNVIEMSPVSCEAGVSLDDCEEALVFSYEGEAVCCAVEFDLYIPEGLTLGDDETLFFEEGSGIPVSKKKPVHTIEMITKANDIPGYTHYYVLIYDSKKTAFVGNELFTVYLDTTEATSGIYPVLLKNVNVGGVAAADNASTPCVTSYVKVGNPTDKSLDVQGCVTTLVNEALASESSISSLNLSEATRINGDFTYVDGRAVTAPTAEVAVTAKYAKTVAEGKYASLTLPFDATFEAETAYKLTNVADGYAMFDAVTTAQAGDVVLLTKSVDLTGTKLGTVASATVASAYYVAADGSELRQGTNVNVPALRGVWEISAASNLRIMLDGVATDIKMVDLQGEGAQAFDLQGRRTANAKSGVYVVNGKKQFVK